MPREWFKRYIVAELLGTAVALGFATVAFLHIHSYAAAAAAGLLGEGIGFYGYFICYELIRNGLAYRHLSPLRRLVVIATKSSTNLLVEFAPAEVIDSLFVRPLLMFIVPQYVHPYMLGFLLGKLLSDVLFYALAIVGYETKKHLTKTRPIR